MLHYLCICGGRDFVWNVHHWRFLDCFADGTLGIANGMCLTGADKLGRLWARTIGIDPVLFEAQWLRYGNAAGPIRNRIMAHWLDINARRNNAEAIVIAFPGGRGTLSMINCAKARGLRVVECTNYTNSIDPKQLGV